MAADEGVQVAIESSLDDGPVGSAPRRGDGDEPSPFAPPRWASDTGRWSWIIVAVVLVAVCAFVVLAAIKLVVLAALFAVLIGGTFLPVVDWLARHHVKRWIAAFLVVIFLILLAVGICLVVLYGLVNQWPEIQDNLQKAWDSIQKALSSTSVSKEQMDSAKANIQDALKAVASGATSAIGDLIGGIAGLIFGIFISINILVWVLIQGRQIGGWASRHMPPVPQPVAYAMLANSARFFRGYIYGSTIVGLFNGAVIFVGALIIGVPLRQPWASSPGSPTTSRTSAPSSAALSPCSSPGVPADRPWVSRC